MTSSSATEPSSVSMLGIVSLLLRGRWLLLTLPPIMAIAFGLTTWLTRDFASRAVFVPQTSSQMPRLGRLSGLAEQFGVDLGFGAGGESIDFYANLLTSREILLAACSTTYAFQADPEQPMQGTLFDLYRIEGSSPRKTSQRAVRALAQDVTVQTDLTSGMVTLTVEAPWPELAEQINRRLLELLQEFNVHKRQSQAVAERRFLETRFQVAGAELRESEDELRRFYETNRIFQESPRLLAERDRLVRQVDLRQQVYTVLAQSLEEARIDEVRDTPVLTLVEAPEGSARPAVRLLTRGVMGLVLGAFFALALVFGQEHFARQRALNPHDYEDVRAMASRFMSELRPWTRRRARQPTAQPGDPAGPSRR